MNAPVSSYLQRPLRTLAEAQAASTLHPWEEAILLLPDHWLNGNQAYVLDEVCAMAPAQAAYVAAAMVEHWTLTKHHGEAVRFMNSLDRRAKEG